LLEINETTHGKLIKKYSLIDKVVFEDYRIPKNKTLRILKAILLIFSNIFKDGISFEKSKNFMRLIIRIRDETHRFSVGFHQKLRDSNMTRSLLDDIKGIGEKKKQYIFEVTNSIDNLKNLSLKDLADVKGLTYNDAKNIYDALHR